MRPFIWNPWLSAWRTPDRPAVVTGDESLSFAGLVRAADRLGVGLRASGVPDGAVVSTDLPAGPRLFALALAALRYGYGLFPVSTATLARPGGRGLLAGSGAVLHVGASGGASSFDDLVGVALSAAALPVAGTPPDRAGYLVFSTSGTTGEPTVVKQARPHRPYRGVAVESRYGSGPDRGPHVMANPTFHLGTLGPALYALQAGSAVVVQPDWSTSDFVALVDRHGAETAFLSPDRLVELVGSGRRPRRDLAVVFHGGAPCAPAVKRAGIALLGPVLHEYYGTSDGVISEIGASQWLRHPGSVGRPLPGVQVWIDAGGVRAPADAPGEVCVRARPAGPGQPRRSIRTGDAGYLADDGHLFVIGRLDEIDSPRTVRFEHAVRCLAGVAEVVVVATPAGVTCHVEASNSDNLAGRIAALAAGLTTSTVDVDVRPVGCLPRTASGKPHRAALAQAPGDRVRCTAD